MYFFKIQRIANFLYRFSLLGLIVLLLMRGMEIFYTPLLSELNQAAAFSPWLLPPLFLLILLPYTRKKAKKPLLLALYLWSHLLALSAYMSLSFFCFQNQTLFLWGALSLGLLVSPLCGFLFLPVFFFFSYFLLAEPLLWLLLSASLLSFFFLFTPPKATKKALASPKK